MARVSRKLFRATPKNAAKLRGGPTEKDLAVGSAMDLPAVVSGQSIAHDLMRMAVALPSPAKKGPGRPRKDVQPVTRQQARYRARMLGKAQEALDKVEAPSLAKTAARVWSEVTGGDGVVLVDGKPVQGGDDASR